MKTDDALADVVRHGLSAPQKHLPPYLFYDEEGSRLFEQITALPEYYPTRTEHAIFARSAGEILDAALPPRGGKLTVLELGAGTATKTQVLLAALGRRGEQHLRYVPADLSPSALAEASARLTREEPTLAVLPLVGTHTHALEAAASSEGRLLVLFVGSSLGNYEDAQAIALLAEIRATLGARGALILGVDAPKRLDVLLPAYDDAAGVTAAFNKNVLRRLNRELGATFELERFRHVARWNARASAVEMHLESLVAQRVRIEALALEVSFAAGETIHTESSHKYDDARIDALLAAAGLARRRSFTDERRWFSVHVAVPR